MIEFINVSKEYNHGVKALDNINIKINKGEFVFLVGPSGSGKGYLIRTFAEACGEKLINIDLNNDSGVSVITGQITPKSELSKEEIDELKEIFKKIIHIPELSDIIVENLSIDSPKTWKPNNFRKILEAIKAYPKEILDEYESLINELKNKII